MTAVSDPALRHLFLAAAEHLAKTGLHKGNLWPRLFTYREGDPACAYGHLIIAAGCPPTGSRQRDLALEAARAVEAHVGAGKPIGQWNDSDEVTADTVIAVFRELAGAP